MKKILTIALYLSIIISINKVSTANAALFNRGGGLIYDSDLNVTWLQDSYAKSYNYDIDASMIWTRANTWANDLIYFDSVRNVTYTDWRLPTGSICSDTGICFGGEMDHLYYNELGGVTYGSITSHHNDNYYLFNNLFNSWYWTSTEYVHNTGIYMAFSMGSGTYQPTYDFGPQYYVMAVRDGDVASISTIPEQTSYVMLLSGLVLLGIYSGKRKIIPVTR